jgi:hypothetical protein
MAVAVVIVIVVRAIAAGRQQPGADKIDRQTEKRHQDRVVEADRNRIEQAHGALIPDQQRDQCKDYGTGKACQFSQLSRAEGKPRVLCMTTGETVSHRGDSQRGGMGGHVPAVGQERHGAKDRAGNTATISATIMTAVRPTTIQVWRSCLSCAAPRKTCRCCQSCSECPCINETPGC